MLKFWLASFVWILMMAVMAWGVYLAAVGKPVVLILVMLGFVVAVYRIGCATH